MICKEVKVVDLNFRAMSNEFFPTSLRGVGDRRGHDAKVFGSLVTANIEKVATVIDVVLVIRFSWTDNFQSGGRSIRRQVLPLARSLALRTQQNHGLVARAAGADVEEFVFLFKDQIRLCTSQNVPKELVRSFGDGVFSSEEDRFVVSGPRHISHSFKRLRQLLTGAQVLDLELVLAVAGG